MSHLAQTKEVRNSLVQVGGGLVGSGDYTFKSIYNHKAECPVNGSIKDTAIWRRSCVEIAFTELFFLRLYIYLRYLRWLWAN